MIGVCGLVDVVDVTLQMCFDPKGARAMWASLAPFVVLHVMAGPRLVRSKPTFLPDILILVLAFEGLIAGHDWARCASSFMWSCR